MTSAGPWNSARAVDDMLRILTLWQSVGGSMLMWDRLLLLSLLLLLLLLYYTHRYIYIEYPFFGVSCAYLGMTCEYVYRKYPLGMAAWFADAANL